VEQGAIARKGAYTTLQYRSVEGSFVDPDVFGPPGSGSGCTDQDPDPDPSIIKQK
jgi:hypothetical protein